MNESQSSEDALVYFCGDYPTQGIVAIGPLYCPDFIIDFL